MSFRIQTKRVSTVQPLVIHHKDNTLALSNYTVNHTFSHEQFICLYEPFDRLCHINVIVRGHGTITCTDDHHFESRSLVASSILYPLKISFHQALEKSEKDTFDILRLIVSPDEGKNIEVFLVQACKN